LEEVEKEACWFYEGHVQISNVSGNIIIFGQSSEQNTTLGTTTKENFDITHIASTASLVNVAEAVLVHQADHQPPTWRM
jgi:hypothetical protein